MLKTKRKCPKCHSGFGIFKSSNKYIGKSRIICVNGDCDWSMNIIDWNKTYKCSQIKDNGFKNPEIE